MVIIAVTGRLGWLGFGYHPDLVTRWFDLWLVGLGFTFTKAHADSRKLKDALRRVKGSREDETP